jgi:hypothetical protein
MKIYIDSECKCHITNPHGIFREIETKFFDGKCSAFIEGYRYCPAGESYISHDGIVFYGECIAPWKPIDELGAAQREYEQAKLAQYEQELPQAYLDGVNSI